MEEINRSQILWSIPWLLKGPDYWSKETKHTFLGLMVERRPNGSFVHYKTRIERWLTTKFERPRQTSRVWPNSKNTVTHYGLNSKGQIYAFFPFLLSKYLQIIFKFISCSTILKRHIWVNEIRINKINYYNTFPSPNAKSWTIL